ALRLDGIAKSFGSTAALSGVSIDAPAGTFVVLLGPSGCGKSTLLRVIAGLERADAGRVFLGGRDVTGPPPAAPGIALGFQSRALSPPLSAAETAVFARGARHLPRAERHKRRGAAAAMLGLGNLLRRRPSQLWGGQQQRVALARAVVAQAPVCLMDEPLSNLD